MDIRPITQSKWRLGFLAIPLVLLFLSGCGEDSTKPKPDVKAMGGILISRGAPAGVPYQAGAVVSVDGQAVTDAQVTINGTPLAYMADPAKPEQTGYVGLVSGSEGQTLTLTATAAGESRTLQAMVPGMVEILPPTGGYAYHDDADITIDWVPGANANFCIVTCAGAGSSTPGMWLLPGTANTYTIPASHTTVPGCRISVLGVNGSGDLPTSMDLRQWTGKSGFWVSCEDYLEVMISG